MKRRSVVRTIAEKDMRAIWSNSRIWLPMLVLPVVLCVVLPAAFVLAVRYGVVSANADIVRFIDAIAGKLPAGGLRDKLEAMPTAAHQMLYLLANYLLTPFFLMVPVLTSLILATNSFVGEKERRTLESLLFAPIPIAALFAGKALAAFVPTMVVSLGGYIAGGIVVNALSAGMFGGLLMTDANWLVLMLWVIPVFSLTTILLSVLVSARAKGFQEAQQIGGIVVLPVVGLIVSQFTGLFLLSAGLLLAIGAALLILNALLFRRIAKMNSRSVLFEKQIH